jgi:pyruvate kinase
MRNTKIVCTIGPSSTDRDTIGKLIDGGMDAARLNFSHGTWEDHGSNYRTIRKLSRERGKPVGLIQDLQGAKIRIGEFGGIGTVTLVEGAKFTLTAEKVAGDQNAVGVDYARMPSLIKKGDSIFIDDGRIELKAIRVSGKGIDCRVKNGGSLSSRKGVILPGKKIDLPGLLPQDEKDLSFGLKLGIDYVAHSFVRQAGHVKRLRRLLNRRGAVHVRIISKIEDGEGVENIEEIIDVSDAIMIARGDMGVCLDRARVPLIQQEIIEKCNRAGKPVVVATQMLDSMVQSPLPTRAEVSDIATAVQEGSDALMLSAETAIGDHPVRAVTEMARIIEVIESSLDYRELLRRNVITPRRGDILDCMSYAAMELALAISAKAIVAMSLTGRTARALCRFKPGVPVFAFTHDPDVAEGLSLYGGVQVSMFRKHMDPRKAQQNALESLRSKGYLEKGDVIVVTRGLVEEEASGLLSFIDVVKI